jgi:hypothetical protein
MLLGDSSCVHLVLVGPPGLEAGLVSSKYSINVENPEAGAHTCNPSYLGGGSQAN